MRLGQMRFWGARRKLTISSANIANSGNGNCHQQRRFQRVMPDGKIHFREKDLMPDQPFQLPQGIDRQHSRQSFTSVSREESPFTVSNHPRHAQQECATREMSQVGGRVKPKSETYQKPIVYATDTFHSVASTRLRPGTFRNSISNR